MALNDGVVLALNGKFEIDRIKRQCEYNVVASKTGDFFSVFSTSFTYNKTGIYKTLHRAQ